MNFKNTDCTLFFFFNLRSILLCNVLPTNRHKAVWSWQLETAFPAEDNWAKCHYVYPNFLYIFKTNEMKRLNDFVCDSKKIKVFEDFTTIRFIKHLLLLLIYHYNNHMLCKMTPCHVRLLNCINTGIMFRTIVNWRTNIC